MSQYPRWWTDKITVCNKWIDNDKIVHYKKTVLDNCFFKFSTSIGTELGSVGNIRGYIVRIPENENFVNYLDFKKQIEDKEFIEEEINNLEVFTLDLDDVIIKGEIEEVIDENVKGSRMNDILEKYKRNAFTVKAVSENIKISPSHYLATGE